MALPSTAVWEVRTDGDDTNGGAFNASRSGATKTADDNYTYGASYGAISYTDLYSDGASLNKLKSDTRAFVTADIGHIIQLGAGTNRTATLFFEITAVASGVATLDANAWSAENSAKDGVGKLGGALATPGKALEALVAGNTAYIKGGSDYTCSADANVAGGRIDISIKGSTARDKPIRVIGYTTDRGDTGHAVLLAGANSISVVDAGNYGYVRNLTVKANSKSDIVGFDLTVLHAVAEDCRAEACVTGFYGDNQYPSLMRCTAYQCTTTGIALTGGGNAIGCIADGCYTGFDGNSQSTAFVNCIAKGCTNAGGRPATYVGCVFYNNAAGGHLYNTSFAINCIFAKSTGYGIKENYALLNIRNCGFYNNTSGNIQTADVSDESGLVEMTADPVDTNCEKLFVDAANGDFRLTRTPYYGAACRAAGIGPVGQTSYPDIGAVQHGDTTAPAVGDVESGVTFGDGAALTGTFAVPAEEDVEDGVTYGAGGTEFEGTLEGGGGNVIVIED